MFLQPGSTISCLVTVCLVGVGLTARSDEPIARGISDYNLEGVMSSLERDGSLSQRDWLCGQLSRAAVGVRDFDICIRSLRHIGEPSVRVAAFRRVCDDIAVVIPDRELAKTARVVAGWQILDSKPQRPNETIDALVKSLCAQGRCAAARTIVSDYQLPQNVESLILTGKIGEAVSLFKEQLGQRNAAQAAIVAANVYVSGGTNEATAFLKAGWPDWQLDWSRDMCLEISVKGNDVGDLFEFCPNEARRTALRRASEELRNWPNNFRHGLKALDITRFRELMDVDDSADVAKLIAACIEQGNASAFADHVHLARPLIRQRQPRPGYDRGDEARRQFCLFKELVVGRLTFRQFSALDRDLDEASAGLRKDAALSCFTDAASRAAKRIAASDLPVLKNALQSADAKLAVDIVFAQGRSGIPEQFPHLESYMREKMRLSFSARLRDELYE